MSLSPGLVHSCAEVLALVHRKPVALAVVRASFGSIGVTPTASTLDFAQKMQWLITNEAGVAEVTDKGQRFLAREPIQARMRQALLDLIEIERPLWIQSAAQGRRQVLDFVNTALAQVFLEAGLIDGTTADVVSFWDALAAQARGQRDITLLHIGRTGERLSIDFEKRRTGRTPRWIAVDNNADGFDLLSVVGPTDSRSLSIEVKATTMGTSGLLHITRNEWEYALTARAHVFHVWDIADGEPRLAVLDCADVGTHIPADRGDGAWRDVTVPCGTFESKMERQGGQAVEGPW